MNDSKILRKAFNIIKNDKELYFAFKDNIALSFKDEYNSHKKKFKYKYVNNRILHEISNKAAENFMKMLVK